MNRQNFKWIQERIRSRITFCYYKQFPEKTEILSYSRYRKEGAMNFAPGFEEHFAKPARNLKVVAGV